MVANGGGLEIFMKTVLITGGSGGIGRELVRAFADAGYMVAFTYKNSELAAKSLAEKHNALAIKADSEVESEVVNAVEAAVISLSHIDCLINCAGVSSFSLLSELSLAEWNRTLGVSLTGAFLYSREVYSHMVKRHFGRIINITSMWGLVGASLEVHYSAAKAGLIGFTKALAKELGPSGITVNAIAPGLIETDMNKTLSEEDIDSIVQETPLMRIGAPGDVSSAALYLAGDGASFITGETINVSGGYVIN